MDPHLLGRIGEELVCRALRGAGWRIRARNLAAPEGELDVVAEDGPVTVVVEVKTGREPPGGWAEGLRPSDRLRSEGARRRQRAALRLAGGGPARVDLVAVEVSVTRHAVHLRHHVDVAPPLSARPSPGR